MSCNNISNYGTPPPPPLPNLLHEGFLPPIVPGWVLTVGTPLHQLELKNRIMFSFTHYKAARSAYRRALRRWHAASVDAHKQREEKGWSKEYFDQYYRDEVDSIREWMDPTRQALYEMEKRMGDWAEFLKDSDNEYVMASRGWKSWGWVAEKWSLVVRLDEGVEE